MQEDNVRGSLGVRFVVHAVIGGEGDGGACGEQAPNGLVDADVEIGGFARPWGVFVLDVIREREVHQVGMLALQDPDAGLQHEEGEVGGIFSGQGFADVVQAIRESVGGGLALVRFFGRERDAILEAGGEHLRELVLGGDGHDSRAVLGKLRQNAIGAQDDMANLHPLYSGPPTYGHAIREVVSWYMTVNGSP